MYTALREGRDGLVDPGLRVEHADCDDIAAGSLRVQQPLESIALFSGDPDERRPADDLVAALEFGHDRRIWIPAAAHAAEVSRDLLGILGRTEGHKQDARRPPHAAKE